MTRLTIDRRNRILRRLIKHRYSKPLAELCEEFKQLAEDVYNDVFDAATRKKMDLLPEGWLPTRLSFRAQFATSYVELRFSGSIGVGRLSYARPELTPICKRMPDHKMRYGCLKAYEAADALSVRYETLNNKLTTLQEEAKIAWAEAEAAIKQCSTLKILVQRWPEIETLVADMHETKSLLPAVEVSALNTKFALPPEAEA